MSNKTYCPILTIGFNPPKQGQRDLRLCNRDCAWFNVSQETCNLSVIAEAVENTEVHAADILNLTVDRAEFEYYDWDNGYTYKEPKTD